LAFKELERSSIPRMVTLTPNGREVTFSTAQGLSFTMVDPASISIRPGPTPVTVEPQVSGGFNPYGTWIGFSPTDQSVLIGGVGATLITAAICAVPGVGWAACTVVGVIVTVAVGYLMANGVCSGGRTLYVYTGSNRNLHAACAYRAPYT